MDLAKRFSQERFIEKISEIGKVGALEEITDRVAELKAEARLAAKAAGKGAGKGSDEIMG